MQTIPIERLPAYADAAPLDAGTIHVWVHRLTETKRGAALRAETRDVLGHLLCVYANLTAPPAIELGTHGKPFAPALPSLDFNLSHSGEHVVLAFARHQAVGIDIETIDRRVAVDDIAARFFSTDEAYALSSLPTPLRLRAFIALWTHKEAVLKAIGEGLGFGLDRVVFAIGSNGDIGGLKQVGDDAFAGAQWQVQTLDIAAPLGAAIAWRGRSRHLRLLCVQ